MTKKNKIGAYEMTLEREVLREKSAGVLADFFRCVRKKDYSDEKMKMLQEQKDIVGKIYDTAFDPEYDCIEKINQAHKMLDSAVDFLNKQ